MILQQLFLPKKKLEQAGIKAIPDDMDVVGMTPLAGIEIRIFARDLEKANQLLGNGSPAVFSKTLRSSILATVYIFFKPFSYNAVLTG